MSPVRQFSELSEPIGTFERLFCAALAELLPDLTESPWYVREREVVNRFVFRWLIPKFQSENLDISQIGIEIPVQVSPQSRKEKPSVSGDIVVWLHSKAGVWLTCKPLARIEWKNISCREKSGSNLNRQHRRDIERLIHNSRLAYLNYAVLTSRQGGKVELLCTRIVDGTPTELLELGPSNGSGTEVENIISKMDYNDAMSRQHECPHCELARSGVMVPRH